MKQTQQILHHLQHIGTITPKQAMDRYGCYRLGARIHELKEAGHPITKEMISVKTRNGKTRVARYAL